MESLGSATRSFRELRPDIIMASISGYGHTGPQACIHGLRAGDRPFSGLASLTGYVGGDRKRSASLMRSVRGITAAAGVLAALVARRQTGRGQDIDLSLWEERPRSSAKLMEYVMNGRRPERMGTAIR